MLGWNTVAQEVLYSVKEAAGLHRENDCFRIINCSWRNRVQEEVSAIPPTPQ